MSEITADRPILVHPDRTPMNVWIVEVVIEKEGRTELWALSRCCEESIYWGTTETREFVYCSSCNLEPVKQPSMEKSSVFYVKNYADEEYALTEWVRVWTGIEDAEVTINYGSSD